MFRDATAELYKFIASWYLAFLPYMKTVKWSKEWCLLFCGTGYWFCAFSKIICGGVAVVKYLD